MVKSTKDMNLKELLNEHEMINRRLRGCASSWQERKLAWRKIRQSKLPQKDYFELLKKLYS